MSPEPLSLKDARIGFVGAGVVGAALAGAMHSRGYQVSAVSSRTTASAERLASLVPGCKALASPQAVADSCDAVFLTVPDDAIAGVAVLVRWRSGQIVVHCSGACPLDALSAAREMGALVGAFHPFQTFADPNRAQAALAGTTFAVEAAPPLRQGLESLAASLGGHTIQLDPKDRVLYHASAVVACGFLVTLVKLAADLWSGFDGDRGAADRESLRAIMPLVRSTVDGLSRSGPIGALTGPFVRGDVGTVQQHLEALAKRAPELLPIYCRLALAELPLAREKGTLTADREADMERLLRGSLEAPGVSGTAL